MTHPESKPYTDDEIDSMSLEEARAVIRLMRSEIIDLRERIDGLRMEIRAEDPFGI